MQDDRQRLDKWLWIARFAKTRTMAVRLVEEGHVRVGGRRTLNPAQGLKLGDVLTLALPQTTVVVRLLGLGLRRGPYEEARLLYEQVGGAHNDGPNIDEGRGDAPLAAGGPGE